MARLQVGIAGIAGEVGKVGKVGKVGGVLRLEKKFGTSSPMPLTLGYLCEGRSTGLELAWLCGTATRRACRTAMP